MTASLGRKIFRKTLRVVLWSAVLLAVLPLLLSIGPVNRFLQNRFHRRIENALSRGLGRPVKGGNLDLTTLSGFGFNMDTVSIAEAPGFGDEPFIYAEKVHFVLSWRSLFSRRLELSYITVRQGSINLVRNGEGRWNFESWFLDQAPAQGSATFSRPSPSLSPRNKSPLPITVYFDTDRINFKDLLASAEKKVFILSEVSGKIQPAWFDNAVDFDLKMKLSRTDLPMENSGLLRLSGSLGPFRSPSLWPSVVQGQARLEKFPYSDAIALLLGRVTSIHGLLEGRATFRGPLNGVNSISGQFMLIDLHSWAARPREQYTSAALSFSKGEIKVGGPLAINDGKLFVGSSEMKVEGRVDNFNDPQLELTVTSEKVHLDDALDFARGFVDWIPNETHWFGDAKLDFQTQGPWKAPVGELGVTVEKSRIQSQSLARPASVDPFSVHYQDGTMVCDSIRIEDTTAGFFQLSGSIENLLTSPQLNLTASGRENRIEWMEGLARSFGLWPSSLQMQGRMDFSLQKGPSRRNAPRSPLNGWVNLRNVTLKPGTREDIRIAAARWDIKNDSSQLSVTKANWGRSVGSGFLQFPQLDFKRSHVTVTASFLDLDELIQLGMEARNLLVPASSTSFQSDRGSSLARPALNWSGKISSNWVYLKPLQVTRVHAYFQWKPQRLHLDGLKFEAYGGSTDGNIDLRWSGQRPQLTVQGEAQNIKLDSLVNLLTPLGPAVQGRVSGMYTVSGEKGKGDPWRKSFTARIQGTARDLKNVNLIMPSSIQEVESQLKISTLSAADSSLSLDLDLEYLQERARINKAVLSRNDFTASFSGVCTKRLDLDLSGTIEGISSKKGSSAAFLPATLRGPMARPQLVLNAPAQR